MRISFYKCLAAGVFAALHVSANASLLDPLEYESDGLIWLQLSETTGLSLNDFTAGVGGWSAKYRFAVDSEIDGLINSFGVSLGDTGYHQHAFGAGAFVASVGGRTLEGPSGTYFLNGDAGAIGRGLGRYVWAELTSGDSPEPLGPNCPAYFSCSRFLAEAQLQPLSSSSKNTGLFLVRQDVVEPPVNVPEPSNLALLGLGALLIYQRREKQK